MSWLDRLEPAGVVDARSFGDYCQQQLGTPYPTGKQLGILTKQAKLFFERNPAADWQTMVRVVAWAKAKHRRPAMPQTLVSWARFAWADGFLPELNPVDATDPVVDEAIREAVLVETDPTWRHRLLACQGVKARAAVLAAWQQRHVETVS